MSPTLHRPQPVLNPPALEVDRSRAPARAAERLLDGEAMVVRDEYGTGLDILDGLRALLHPPGDDAAFTLRQAFRRRYLDAARLLLAPVSDHRIALEGAPSIGFLKLLYPELSGFGLPYLDVEDLANAWRRYDQGISMAVLGHPLHPFYGAYVPTRTTHLELFGTWISQYAGARERAVDVGTGCGVLALMLVKAGFARVLATDDSPNAIESVRRELGRLPSPNPVDLRLCDLLTQASAPVDLIVFNPPWTMGQTDGLLDHALNFEQGLFERFFEQAAARLSPTGRVVLLFSNIMQLVQPDLPHPILAELERGRFTLVQKLNRKVKPTPGPDGKRRRTKEKVEVWELALS